MLPGKFNSIWPSGVKKIKIRRKIKITFNITFLVPFDPFYIKKVNATKVAWSIICSLSNKDPFKANHIQIRFTIKQVKMHHLAILNNYFENSKENTKICWHSNESTHREESNEKKITSNFHEKKKFAIPCKKTFLSPF